MSSGGDHDSKDGQSPPPSEPAPGHGVSSPEAKSQPTTPADVDRRRFLIRMSVSVAAVGGAAISVPGLGFVIAPLFREAPEVWRSVGKVSAFELGATVNVVFLDASPLPWAGVTAKTSAWLRRTGEVEFVAFAVNCAHLGCPVRWLPDANLFMCPCHGGVYYADGRVAAGPPPRPLTRYPVRVRDGEVEINTAPIPIG